ncbi:MAG: hypothetical protein JXA21_07445 [Anaerolineae bacterium]|nr:hypothetical protein [Anaerolineae bacterium]
MGEAHFVPKEPLPRMEPYGPEDKEAAFWNNEADHIEAWAAEVGDPEAYMQDVLQRMSEPTDVPATTDIGSDLGSDLEP